MATLSIKMGKEKWETGRSLVFIAQLTQVCNTHSACVLGYVLMTYMHESSLSLFPAYYKNSMSTQLEQPFTARDNILTIIQIGTYIDSVRGATDLGKVVLSKGSQALTISLAE